MLPIPPHIDGKSGRVEDATGHLKRGSALAGYPPANHSTRRADLLAELRLIPTELKEATAQLFSTGS